MTAETATLYYSKGDLPSLVVDFLQFPIEMIPVDSANIITKGEFKGKKLNDVFPTAQPPLLDNGCEFKTTDIAIIMFLLENTRSERLMEYPLGSEARFCCFDNLHRISGLNAVDLEEEDLEFTDNVSMEQLVIYFLIKDVDVSYFPNLCRFKAKFEKFYRQEDQVEHSNQDRQALDEIYDRYAFSNGFSHESVNELHSKLEEELSNQGFDVNMISLAWQSIIVVDLDEQKYLLDLGLNGPLKPAQIKDGAEFAAGGGRFLKMEVYGSTVSVKLWNTSKYPKNYCYQDLYVIDLDENGGRVIERDQGIVFVKRKQDGSSSIVSKLLESNGKEKFEVKMIDYSGNCLRSKVYALSEGEVEWQGFISDFEAAASS